MVNKNYELEIIVNGKPVYEYPFNGDTYIEGRKGSTFKIRFKNRTLDAVLVVPSVDGISTMNGQPAGPDSPGFVVQGMGTVELPGWMIDSAKSSEFTFADRERSYAVSQNSTTTNTGVIGMMVFEQQMLRQPYVSYPNSLPNHPPHSRRLTSPFGYPEYPNTGVTWTANTADISNQVQKGFSVNNSAQSVEDTLGVSWGKSVDFVVNSTTFDKGNKVAELVVFYDSRKNLERRGIIVERRDSLSVRPNPFPGIGCVPPTGWKG